MLIEIEKKIKLHKSNLGDKNLPQASVLIALTECQDPKIIFTLRSKIVSSHSGEVALPGGMKDMQDKSLEHTALRESYEEIGLDSKEVNIFGSIDPLVSRYNVSVMPFVGSIPETTVLNEDSKEIDSIFMVPLSFFLEDKRFRNDPMKRNGETFYVPAYKYESYVIWGLTAMIMVNFLNLTLDLGIDLLKPVNPRE